MASRFCGCLLAASLLHAVDAGRKEERTVPALNPEGHRTFFGKDYPHDIQPSAHNLEKDFTHPYPEMQDDNSYDKDYVKDENGDDGEWQAQTHYDHLRTALQRKKAEQQRSKEYKDSLTDKLAKAKEEERKAAEAAGGEKNKLTDLEKKQKEEEAARKKAEQAEEELRKANKAKKDADASTKGKATEDSDGKESDGDDSGKAVDGASKDVEKELKDIENCKKELEKAQAELKRLQDERIAAEKNEQMARSLQADKLKADAQAKKDQQALLDKLKAEEDAYNQAQANADSKGADYAKMKADMEKAEDNLRSLRRKQVDSGGGVYRSANEKSAPRSAAFKLAMAPVTGILALVALLA